MAVEQLPDDQEDTRAAAIRRLLAKGTDIVLRDGSVLELVLTPAMLARLEIEYGSLSDFSLALQANMRGRLFHHVSFVLAMAMKTSQERMLEQMDSRRIGQYLDAITAALIEALPDQEGVEGNADGQATNLPVSPGASSSISPSPSSDSRRGSSGTR